MAKKDPFEGIEDVQARRNQQYEGPGAYLQIIENVKEGTNKDGLDFIAVEKRVIHCLSLESKTLAYGQELIHHKPGDLVTDLMIENKVYFKQNFKAFMICVMDDEEIVISRELSRSVLQQDPENPSILHGIIVHMNNRPAKSKDSNKVYTIKGYQSRVRYSDLLKYMDMEQIKIWVPKYEEFLAQGM